MTAVSITRVSTTPLIDIHNQLMSRGWVLLRDEGYDLNAFSRLLNDLCTDLTFDPAREYVTPQVQKVDAGNAAVGLHIENGNTPLPPELVAFYSELSARHGAQTTFCDGALVYRALPYSLRQQFKQPITVSRFLPRILWQRYVAVALGIDDSQAVGADHLDAFIKRIPGQEATPWKAGGIQYTLTLPAIREDNFIGIPAFANAILGPSYNYEPPVFRFEDGSLIKSQTIDYLRNLCETYTRDITWQDGDVLILDNKRFMHGRRHIPVALDQRKLHIGMGSSLKTW